MASKSEGAVAIANLEGKKMRNRVVNVIEALPLTSKSDVQNRDIRNKNKLNKIRERKYQMV